MRIIAKKFEIISGCLNFPHKGKIMSEAVEVRLPEIQIPVREVIRRMGYPTGKSPDPGIQQLLSEEMKRAAGLFQFRGIYRALDIQEISDDILSFHEDSFEIQSRQVCRMLRNAKQAVFFMVTIGKGLEEDVRTLLEQEETTRAFILDAVGSETADEAANVLHWKTLSDLARQKGLTATPRFSPGYGDWPVTVQPDMLRICEGGRIGISVTESCLMIPRKSVSAVLGFE
jgi:cobalamin-dependent methionine synthase I